MADRTTAAGSIQITKFSGVPFAVATGGNAAPSETKIDAPAVTNFTNRGASRPKQHLRLVR
jgi:hypothetical protein